MADLLQRLEQLGGEGLQKIRQAMQKSSADAWQITAQFYRSALTQLIGSGQISEKSCSCQLLWPDCFHGGKGSTCSMICRSHLVFRFQTPVEHAYALEQSLGQGGIGQVVQATCKRSRAKRAIKIMSRKSDPSGFEIALMSKLDHPNILRLFETFEEPMSPNTFLAIELCRGGPLPNYAREFWPPLEEVTHWKCHVQFVITILNIWQRLQVLSSCGSYLAQFTTFNLSL
eukprot:symbB.v1.2.030483.t1/scaffold3434.1/size111337/8